MKTILYVGLEAPKRDDVNIIHCPLIHVIPLNTHEVQEAFTKLPDVSHIIVTSKTAVSCLQHIAPLEKVFLSVGKATTSTLERMGAKEILTATNECQEGVITLIENLTNKPSHLFWGHSSLSRPLLRNYCEEKHLPLIECVLYQTLFSEPKMALALDAIDEIYFTSPSTVESFFHFFGPPPKQALLHTQGEVTKNCLLENLSCT